MSLEKRIKIQIGELVVQIHDLQDQLETANAKIAELEKKKEDEVHQS